MIVIMMNKKEQYKNLNELRGILITYKNEIAKVKFDRDHKDFFKHIRKHTG